MIRVFNVRIESLKLRVFFHRKNNRRPSPKSGGSAMPEPVAPTGPKTLSGGAAAALEFDN